MIRWILILLVLGAIVAAFVPSTTTIFTLLLFIAIFFLARNLDFGLILLVFFFPYLGLVIDFSAFEIFREAPYLRSINAPFIDLYGLMLFAAWGLHIIKNAKFKIKNENTDKILHFPFSILNSLPHWRSYLLFWFSGLISLMRVPSIQLDTSIKYFLRPFTFFYLVFFAPVVSILTKIHNPTSSPSPGLRPSSPAGRGASKHFPSPSGRGEGEGQRGGREGLLHRVLTVFYWTGLLSAVDGLLGLFFGAHTGFPRATPFGFFGVNPLGPNHNLLAETLIATAPAGLILATRYTLHATRYNWIRYGMWFQWAVALLTFARTAWIAVVVQGMLYLWFEHRGRLRKVWERARLATLPLLLLLPLLLFTLFSETVRGSTLSRLDQARIAVFYFLRSPWIGQGVGTFIPTLWQTKAFLLEYGEPLEAHGIIFKLMFEQGAFGLITFAFFAGLILLVIWRAYRRTPNTAALAALLIASGSLTYQLFNTTYYTSKLWVPMALAFAIAKIYANTDHHTKMVS